MAVCHRAARHCDCSASLELELESAVCHIVQHVTVTIQLAPELELKVEVQCAVCHRAARHCDCSA